MQASANARTLGARPITVRRRSAARPNGRGRERTPPRGAPPAGRGGPHGGAGRPRCRPDKLHADKGYDYRRCRRYLTRRGIKVRIARRGIEDKSRLGRVRWVVERTISWLLRFKRLGLRYDRTERTTPALLTPACTVINVRRLMKIELCDQ